MPCFHSNELEFALSLFRRLRIPAHQLPPDAPMCRWDGGLRQLLGLDAQEQIPNLAAHQLQPCTIYKMVDRFACRYIYFQLHPADPSTLLILGPYLTSDPSQEDLMEMAERQHVPMSHVPHLASHYAALPVYPDPSVIFAIVYTLCQSLWGNGHFDTVDVEADQRSQLPADVSVSAPIEQEHILQQMQQMEERYAYEDRLMEIVATGSSNQAELLLTSVSQLNFQPRTSDPLRNQKNYCIICNTLLRKAAQRGGVHPFHIDKMSSHFARSIENATTLSQCSAILSGMVTDYCHLVHTQTRVHYSPAVQKVISYIQANVSGDLSLPTLARLIQVTPSYLSALFRRETQHTLAEHITQARMQTALSLLATTQLQIQTIAQLCGFNDPNYFGKQFKQHVGLTPQQYRHSQAR